MTLLADEMNVLLGSQRPRITSAPDFDTSTGEEAIELAAMAGLDLDPWQQYVLTTSLGERADGSWAAFEVGLCVSRQNGKGGLLEARELAGLFLLGERLIIHSAHQFDTSIEHFRRILGLIEDTPDLVKRVKRVSNAHGNEGIELTTGQRIRFRTRTKGGGRGFTGDLLVLDEAMDIPEATHGALLPTLSARPNPQVWYTGSAVDQLVDDNGIVFSRVRERGLEGSPRLAYFEWSAEADIDHITPDFASDPDNWAEANPAIGIRISPEHVSNERSSMSTRKFAVERLGIGDWPDTSERAQRLIHPDAWTACTDKSSRVEDPVTFAIDISPDRSSACIAVAGHRSDDLLHVEVVEHRRGTGWVVDRLLELLESHRYSKVVLDGYAPAGSLASEIGQTIAKNSKGKPKLYSVSAKEYTQACGVFFDAVADGKVRHLGTEQLAVAVDGSATRPLGEAWAWSRKNSDVDITPLVACTLALWGVEPKRNPQAWDLNEIAAEMLRREQEDE